MNEIELLQSKFPNIRVFNNKIETDGNLFEILHFLKNCPELSYDTLFTIIAVDYTDYVELIYPLISTFLNRRINISANVKDKARSVVEIYPAAYFDECEIYDLFGIKFEGNKRLRRLFMPESWLGHPLKKNYVLNDERLNWNG